MVAAGLPALWFALFACVGSAILAAAGARRLRPGLRRASELALVAAFAGAVVALCALASAFVSRDLAYRTVATYTCVLTSRRHALSGLWAGHAGQLLWLAVGVLGAGVITMLAHRRRPLQGLVSGVCASVGAVPLVQLCTTISPFTRLPTLPPDGRGMHPLLMHAAMPVQPALVLLGLALTTIPFAWVVASSTTGAPRAAWRDVALRWVVAAWTALTIALGIGLWWAQQQLGWFGYYLTWEPYAGAPLLPWLALSALVLAFCTGVDRRAEPVWTGAFIVFTFLLSVFAFHRLRTGIEDSVRAVAGTPATVQVVLGASALSCALLVGLTGLRLPREARRRRAGSATALAGALLAAAGCIASVWRSEQLATVDTGDVATATDAMGGRWRFTSMGLSSYEETDHTVLAVVVNATQDGRRVGLLTSQQRQYFDAQNNATFEPSTTVGSAMTWREAVSVAFLGPADRTTAIIRIAFVPLVPLLYAGVLLLVAGVPLAAWPERVRLPALACLSCGASQADVDARFCADCGAPLRG